MSPERCILQRMRSIRRFRVPSKESICVLLLSLCFHATSVDGQVAETGQPSNTLHVYEDLVQVPTLVLTQSHAKYPDLSPQAFSVRFDGGPVAHPSDVRLEGNDPLALALLLDVSQKEQLQLVKRFAAQPDPSPADIFTGSDRMSVFADDCNLVRSLQNVPGSYSGLRAGVSSVLASPTLHGSGETKARCGGKRRLWDVIATTILQMQKLPGRRVLIVVTDGLDRGSAISPDEVRRLAIRSGVTIFGIQPAQPVNTDNVISGRGATQLATDTPQTTSLTKDEFATICDGTGGLTTSDESNTIAYTLRRVIEFMRERYILDFQRPSNTTAGDHSIAVRVPDSTAFVRVSGAVFPLRDPQMLHDPSTVPSDLSHAPHFGDQKPKPPE